MAFSDSLPHHHFFQHPMLLHPQNTPPEETIRALHLLIEGEADAIENNLYPKVLLEGDGAVSAVDRDNELLWVCSACNHLELHIDTLALATSIFDRVLGKVRCLTKYVNVLAVTSLIIAAKYYEKNGSVVTEPNYVIQSLQLPYSCKEIVRMERVIMAHLDWDLSPPTTDSFLYQMLKLLGISTAITSYPIHQNFCSIISKWKFLSIHRPSVVALTLISVMLEIKSQDWVQVTMGIQKMFKIPQQLLVNCREQMVKTFNFCQNDLKKWNGPVSCGQASVNSNPNGILRTTGIVNKRSKKRLRRRLAKEALHSPIPSPSPLIQNKSIEEGGDVLHILYTLGSQTNLVCL
uniref:CYCLIN domain-containing protein n=1 Tax=Rhabditophanes sp. KR3021 TaxID=114890 RepID=A0AC35TIC7_9BILA